MKDTNVFFYWTVKQNAHAEIHKHPLKSIENRPCDIEYNDADDDENAMLFVDDTDGAEVKSFFHQ